MNDKMTTADPRKQRANKQYFLLHASENSLDIAEHLNPTNSAARRMFQSSSVTGALESRILETLPNSLNVHLEATYEISLEVLT